MAKQTKAGAKSSPRKKESATEPDKLILQTIRLDPDRHDALRTLAFKTRRSQHNILLEGVDMVLKKYKGK